MHEDKPYMHKDKPYMHEDKPYMYDIIQICTNDKPDMYDDMTDMHDDMTDMYEYHIHVWYHVPWGVYGPSGKTLDQKYKSWDLEYQCLVFLRFTG